MAHRPGDIVTIFNREGYYVVFDVRVPGARGHHCRFVQDTGRDWTAHVAHATAGTLAHRPEIEIGGTYKWQSRNIEVLAVEDGMVRGAWTQVRNFDGYSVTWPVEAVLPLHALVLENLRRFA